MSDKLNYWKLEFPKTYRFPMKNGYIHCLDHEEESS